MLTIAVDNLAKGHTITLQKLEDYVIELCRQKLNGPIQRVRPIKRILVIHAGFRHCYPPAALYAGDDSSIYR